MNDSYQEPVNECVGNLSNSRDTETRWWTEDEPLATWKAIMGTRCCTWIFGVHFDPVFRGQWMSTRDLFIKTAGLWIIGKVAFEYQMTSLLGSNLSRFSIPGFICFGLTWYHIINVDYRHILDIYYVQKPNQYWKWVWVWLWLFLRNLSYDD